jgi:predicted restriction endonuclease
MRLYGAKGHGLYMENAYDLTLGEARQQMGFATTDEFAKFLRTHARRWARTNLPNEKCEVCDYSLVTELAHIKGLKEFDENSIVRSTFENNLVRLCPNHHWEFDHGYLTL